MNNIEIGKLLALIKRGYPNSYKYLEKLGEKEEKKETGEIVQLWLGCLHDIACHEAEKAAVDFMKYDRTGFAPTPGQIRGIAEDNIRKRESDILFTRLIQKSMNFLPEDNRNLLEEANNDDG